MWLCIHSVSIAYENDGNNVKYAKNIIHYK